jgi:hypothetical protein
MPKVMEPEQAGRLKQMPESLTDSHSSPREFTVERRAD